MRKWRIITLSFVAFVCMSITTLANEIRTADDIPYEQHIVQKDDTLWKIAGYYHCDFEELLYLNSYIENPNLIYPLDKIRVPLSKVKGVYLEY